ncbi:MAG TPA: ATP-grasp domain-containing protein [Pyrinomonadaceae bacterium]|nr:ATP-grasp domain-containing protein [Pyrinomonadaceae bacterium]
MESRLSESRPRSLNVLCLASFFKGADFMRECAARGARVFLLTRERTLGEDWPRDAIAGLLALPDSAGPEDYLRAVVSLARDVRVDRLVALEEFDVLTAARLREHLALAGMGGTTARRFRDKLLMRSSARDAGLLVPDFTPVFNFDALDEFTSRVPAPWVLKPRSDVSAIGIKKLDTAAQLSRAIDALDARTSLDERSPSFLLERFVAGDVFHVDSLVEAGRVRFAWASRYGRPPMEVAHGGGSFLSYTVEHGSPDERELFAANRRLLKALGLARGAAHAEFIRGREDGRLYFLEVAARVGGAFTAENVEAGSGVNLWREWAKLELAAGDGTYRAPKARREHSGIVLSLARQERPDTSRYDDPEIAFRAAKPYHVGLVVRAKRPERVRELLDAYARRFADEFVAVAPPLEKPPL